MSNTTLHPSIVALVSLASSIAARHQNMGLCQIDKLKGMGISHEQIQTVIEIAQHIRDESVHKFDEKLNDAYSDTTTENPIRTSSEACCTPTASGQSCC